MDWVPLHLGLQVAIAACFSFGGVTVVLGPLQNVFVSRDGLMTADTFSQSYAVSTAAPGPNGPIFMALIGYQMAGVPGIIACVVGWAIPTLFLMHWFGRLSSVQGHPRTADLLSVLNAGAVGLVLAGVLSLVKSFEFDTAWTGYAQCALAVVAAVVVIRGWLSPLTVLLGCMAIGFVLL